MKKCIAISGGNYQEDSIEDRFHMAEKIPLGKYGSGPIYVVVEFCQCSINKSAGRKESIEEVGSFFLKSGGGKKNQSE